MEIAGSRCRIVGDFPSEGGAGPVVVLLHGFGAPGDDLVPLARAMRAAARHRLDGATFVFPEAPLDLGPAFAGGRAWWWVDLAVRAARGRDLRAWQEAVPDGLEEARAKVVALLDAIEERSGRRAVLGGFSQGAMLSVDVALHRPRPPAALVLLSGALVAKGVWEPRAPALAGVPVFQSHGTADDVLPFASAEALRDLLLAAAARVVWSAFPGAHGIPPEVVEGAATFVASLDTYAGET